MFNNQQTYPVFYNDGVLISYRDYELLKTAKKLFGIRELMNKKTPKTYPQAHVFFQNFEETIEPFFENEDIYTMIKKDFIQFIHDLAKNDQNCDYYNVLAYTLLRIYEKNGQLDYHLFKIIKCKYIFCKLSYSAYSFSITPLIRSGKKQTIELNGNTVLIHQTSLENAKKILMENKFTPKESNDDNYIGSFLYFGVQHSIESYVPHLSEDESKTVSSNRYGSVSFKIKRSDIGICNSKGKISNMGYNMGERKFKYEHSHLFLLSDELYSGKEIVFLDASKKKFSIQESDYCKIKWEATVNGYNFTNVELCIDDSLELPSEFTIQIVDHGSNQHICVKRKKGQDCSDCYNDVSKIDIFNSIKCDPELIKRYKITDLGDFNLKFSPVTSDDLNNLLEDLKI